MKWNNYSFIVLLRIYIGKILEMKLAIYIENFWLSNFISKNLLQGSEI